MTKTQKRNARKVRAAGRVVHHDIELAMVEQAPKCSHFGGYCREREMLPFLRKGAPLESLEGFCSGALPQGMTRCNSRIDTSEIYTFLEIFGTNASGLEDDFMRRLRRSHEVAKNCGAALEIRWTNVNGSETTEGEQRWLVGTDLEAVVADVIAAVFTQGQSLSRQTS